MSTTSIAACSMASDATETTRPTAILAMRPVVPMMTLGSTSMAKRRTLTNAMPYAVAKCTLIAVFSFCQNKSPTGAAVGTMANKGAGTTASVRGMFDDRASLKVKALVLRKAAQCVQFLLDTAILTLQALASLCRAPL
eukprot:CAMPEP_0177245498 /NCGR_PEP_ID=MMETSP0367-20130122/50488_1 /TAXON_ID=447022 ORGANISM="Scrippsiella hangoei-like, Strain SHHI-4" /NCGR_SAMPLE_ID=MMETSP0367 /ASSEMBLY_ACC=CAM_ASM_000362 /LENGTH=137 /DNA_ID=CAMNT_0018697415 /DNA_START=544 /DNA_END=957 /DNA_ORIENTATION=+